MKKLEFITLLGKDGRQSSLGINLKHDDNGYLNIVGGLSHCDQIKPKTGADRDRLVKFLKDLDYSD
jgi:hypothetical protein